MQYRPRHTLTDGRQLKAARIIVGLTIREIADLIGMNRNSIMRAESFESLPFHTFAGDRISEALQDIGIEFVVQDGKPGILFSGATERSKFGCRRRPKA